MGEQECLRHRIGSRVVPIRIKTHPVKDAAYLETTTWFKSQSVVSAEHEPAGTPVQSKIELLN